MIFQYLDLPLTPSFVGSIPATPAMIADEKAAK